MLTGIVLWRDGTLMLLRTRAGDQELLLRRDTRYVENGAPAATDNLKVNARCSVRAGRDLDGHIEAYQVMWGDAQGEP
jgi:hypothetical protein